MRRTLFIAVAGLLGTSCGSSSHSGAASVATATPSSTSTPGVTPTATPTATPLPPDQVSKDGGTVAHLNFAIVGDTRPPIPDDTGGYPTAIITKIWQDVEAEHVPFSVTTGDYVFADPFSGESGKQLDLYMGARHEYSGTVFYALGNHECNSLTQSNCGPGTLSGITNNFQAFLDKMMAPMGQTKPYYYVKIDATDGSWTAKFVVIAANAWFDDQKQWLETVMSIPTTYTFVVRHEDVDSTTAPGVPDSNAILAAHPYTLLLAGHVHTFSWTPSKKQVITGNGGAPLNTAINYGYTVIRQQDDGTLVGENYDYQDHSVIGSFHVDASGNEVQ